MTKAHAMSMRVVLACLGLTLLNRAGLAGANGGEVPIRTPRCELVAKFDATRYSTAGMAEWLKLSHFQFKPCYLDATGDVLAPAHGDPTLVEEGIRSEEVALGSMVAGLSGHEPPEPLRPVAAWVRAELEASISAHRRAQEFCRTGLQSALASARPPSSCDAGARAFNGDLARGCRWVSLEWIRCELEASRKARGPYPADSRKRFLATSGVELKPLRCDDP